MNEKVLERPSKSVMETNLSTTYYLSFSDIPHAKAVSTILGAKEWYLKHRREVGKATIPFMEARYKAIDALIKKTGITQVIEFAAGRSVRGINNPQWNFIHSDYDSHALREMKRAVHRMGMKNTNLHFIQFDVITRRGMNKVMRSLNNAKVAVIHSGLTTYYPHATKEKIAHTVQFLLKKYGGVYITPDIPTLEYDKKLLQITPDHDQREKTRSTFIGRDLKSFKFKTYKEIHTFYSSLGFKIVRYKIGDLVSTISSIKRLYKNSAEGKKIEDIVKNREIWLMTVP